MAVAAGGNVGGKGPAANLAIDSPATACRAPLLGDDAEPTLRTPPPPPPGINHDAPRERGPGLQQL